jgi:transcriptional regulator EpsA
MFSEKFARLVEPPFQTTWCKSLQTSQSTIANSVVARRRQVRTCRAWNDEMATDNITKTARAPAAKGFQLTDEEAARFLRIVSKSLLIKRHYQLFVWLNGDVQQFLPHQILISAWGDFAKWNLKLDVISGLPGVRTEQIAHCRIDDVLRPAYAQWIDARRQPLVLAAETILTHAACACPVHSALRGMRSLLVHGVRDERGGHESLYIALSSGSFTKGRSRDRFVSLVDSLIPQIDVAFRKVAAFPLEDAKPWQVLGRNGFELSEREQEILGWVWQGTSNADIATVLDISPFTVKNHVQRIFRKIGVSNRTQAAARYNQALQELRESLDK